MTHTSLQVGDRRIANGVSPGAGGHGGEFLLLQGGGQVVTTAAVVVVVVVVVVVIAMVNSCVGWGVVEVGKGRR